MDRQSFFATTIYGLLGVLLAVTADAGSAPTETPTTAPVITVMSYNVENLFDTVHDQGKSDWEFLPKSDPQKAIGCEQVTSGRRQECLQTDWTEERLNNKLQNLKKIIESAAAMPDIIGVQEVENINVLKMLADVAGYPEAILEEGPDERGIDVGLIYKKDKLEYIRHVSHPALPDDPSTKTRDILAVYFNVKGTNQKLAVYVNHWPSQANPVIKRFKAAETLKKIVDEDAQKFGADFSGIALGDFNTIPRDWPHPHNSVILDSAWSNHLVDVRNEATAKKVLKKNISLGSYFFPPEMAWVSLDHFFVTQGLIAKAGTQVDLASYDVLQNENSAKTFEYKDRLSPLFGSIVTSAPRKNNPGASTAADAGASDHFPIVVQIKVR